MSGYAAFVSLFLLAFLTSLRSSAQQQNPTYIYHVCPNTSTYSKNSTYSSNLRTLLSSLSSNSPIFSSGFYKTVTGQSPDIVFGLFLCRGDVSPELCGDCVVFAVNDTLSRCPEEKESIIWYDECMLRYSDQNLFLESSLQNGTNGIILYNTQNVTSIQINRFSDLLLSTMNQTATKAASSSGKFETIEVNFTALQSLYGLVQCIPDLTRQGCLSCLEQTISLLPTDKIGGRVVMPSCSSRYELYLFFNETVIRSPPPQLDSTSTPPPISIPSPPPGLTIHFPLMTCFSANFYIKTFNIWSNM